MTVLASVSLFLALLPVWVYWRNRSRFLPPPFPASEAPPAKVSVLIPARNEEASIAACVEFVLASRGVEVEVIVLDDHSEDRTAKTVLMIADRDARVRLESAPPLPVGWCGKQHACFTLSKLASHPILTFLDADVRLAPDALARMVAFLGSSKAGLVSGFPRQETATWLERLVIPLINWLLVCYLPMWRMRRTRNPRFSAGCGQWFMTTREAYDQVGGHAAVRASLHDGVKLPRAYRAAGLQTDICDATELAACRMYRSASQVWNGLAKNAREGLGSPGLIWIWTVLLLGGQVLPYLLMPIAIARHELTPAILAALSVALVVLLRFITAHRFRSSLFGAVLHPVGVSVLLAIQWYATARHWLGRPIGWKGRSHPTCGPVTP